MVSSTKTTGLWTDIKEYRRAYILTAVASFGGMLFGWDTVRKTSDGYNDGQN